MIKCNLRSFINITLIGIWIGYFYGAHSSMQLAGEWLFAFTVSICLFSLQKAKFTFVDMLTRILLSLLVFFMVPIVPIFSNSTSSYISVTNNSGHEIHFCIFNITSGQQIKTVIQDKASSYLKFLKKGHEQHSCNEFIVIAYYNDKILLNEIRKGADIPRQYQFAGCEVINE